jgi:hypothetical protein
MDRKAVKKRPGYDASLGTPESRQIRAVGGGRTALRVADGFRGLDNEVA